MSRFFPFLVLLCALGGALTGPAAANDVTTCNKESGDVAIAACTRAISSGKSKGDQLASLYNNRGHEYRQKGELNRAISDYSEAIRLDPKDPDYYENRGYAYFKGEQFDRALPDLDEAIRLNPKKASLYAKRGSVLSETGQLDRAIADHSEAIRLDPKGDIALHNRALVYRQKGDLDRAIADFSQSIRLNPKDPLSYHARGNTYSRKGDLVRAMRDMDDAIRLDPKNASVYISRGSILDEKGEYDRAIADYSEAIRLDPKNDNTHHHRGVVHRRKGDLDRAIIDFSESIRLNPKDPISHQARGNTYSRKGDLDRAMRDMDEAIRLDPKFAGAYRDRGGFHEEKGQFEKALVDYRLAVSIDSQVGLAPEGIRRIEQKLAVAGGAKPAAAPQAAPAAAPGGPRVALVIGNGDYRHATKLPNPSNDAADISRTLRKLGFDVVEGRDLDKRTMEDKVREFGRKLDRAEVALFFYAGHGLQVGGRNYLLPVDSKLERAADLNFETIDVSLILGQMEAEQRVNLVFLDACRDNPLSRSLARSLGTRSASVGQGLASIQSAVGTMIAYATQPDAVALDGEGRNSPFTSALVKHLSTPGVDIGALMRRVRTDVYAATRGKQVPWDHSSLMGEVILAR